MKKIAELLSRELSRRIEEVICQLLSISVRRSWQRHSVAVCRL